jgi:hypothetical protein
MLWVGRVVLLQRASALTTRVVFCWLRKFHYGHSWSILKLSHEGGCVRNFRSGSMRVD